MRPSILARTRSWARSGSPGGTSAAVRLLGSPVPREALSASTLIANVFGGGDRTRVKMTIGDRAPIEMTRAARPDVSSHIWIAHLPGDLAPGAYPVAVEATGNTSNP